MKINEIKFGHIIVEDKRYDQIVIADGEIEERDEKKLEDLFGTTHQVGEWEAEALLKGNPQYIIIGNGYSEAMEVQPEIVEKLQNSAAEILILRSPTAANKYNELVEQDKKVNVLIHTTC